MTKRLRDDNHVLLAEGPLMQFQVAGGSSACTAMATVAACFHCLAPTLAEDDAAVLELWVRQGAALHQTWLNTVHQQQQQQDSASMAMVTEILDLVAPAWPVKCGEEIGGMLTTTPEFGEDGANVALVDALSAAFGGAGDESQHHRRGPAAAAVLTFGGHSVAILRRQHGGLLFLFDSADATLRQFGSCADLAAFIMSKLQQHIDDDDDNVIYALTTVVLLLQQQQQQESGRGRVTFFPPSANGRAAAMRLADTLPAGFFYVFYREHVGYAVAGLHDMMSLIADGSASQNREWRQVVRADQPVTLHMGIRCNNSSIVVGEGTDSARSAEAAEEELVQGIFGSSCFTSLRGSAAALSDSTDDGVVVMVFRDQGLWFDNLAAMEAFIRSRVTNSSSGAEEFLERRYHFERDPFCSNGAADVLIPVDLTAAVAPPTAKLYDEDRTMSGLPFSVCSASSAASRFDRAPLPIPSPPRSPPGSPFPFSDGEEASPSAAAAALEESAGDQQPQEQQQQQQQQWGNEAFRLLAVEAERILRQELRDLAPPLLRCSGVIMEGPGLITFAFSSSSSSSSALINSGGGDDDEGREWSVVADLKQRVFFCDVVGDGVGGGGGRRRRNSSSSSSSRRTFSSFPPAVDQELWLANDADLVPDDGDGSGGVFPASSTTAQMVLAFAAAVFESRRNRSVPPLPAPGTCDVRLLLPSDVRYVVDPLPNAAAACSRDGGSLSLHVTLSQVIIRCNGRQCTARGDRLCRPSHSSGGGVWNLSFLFPPSVRPASLALALPVDADVQLPGGGGGGRRGARRRRGAAMVGDGGGTAEFPAFAGSPDAFLAQSNLIRALGFDHEALVPVAFFAQRIKAMKNWAMEASNGPVLRKCDVMHVLLCRPVMAACYRDCLSVAPDFEYPLHLEPSGPTTLAVAVWIHLAQRRMGLKRVGEDEFYMLTTTADGKPFYKTITASSVLASVFTYAVTPNMATHVMWSKLSDDLRRLLSDTNQFPITQLSKRYLGFSNAVYDLEANEALTWDQVRGDPSIVPFNCLPLVHFPIDVLERAKANVPRAQVVDVNDSESAGASDMVDSNVGASRREVRFSHERLDFVSTPLFDGPLMDQEFSVPTIFWLLALLGRMFHYVPKEGGDNWEIVLFLCGAPSTFKSSLVAFLMRFLQPDQFAVISHAMDPKHPIEGIPGKLMAFITECMECNIDRALFKLLASSDPVKVLAKYKTAANVNWNIPLLFAGNGFLRDMPDPDGAVERRSAVFPFGCMLQSGQGSTDLVDLIFEHEAAAVLIKMNTMYLELRRAIRGRVSQLLPREIREATAQATLAADTFRSFLLQHYVVTHDAADRTAWDTLWDEYVQWCRRQGRRAYTVDPFGMEAPAMFSRLGIALDANGDGSSSSLSLTHIRRRRPGDPPAMPSFRIRTIRRSNSDAAATAVRHTAAASSSAAAGGGSAQLPTSAAAVAARADEDEDGVSGTLPIVPDEEEEDDADDDMDMVMDELEEEEGELIDDDMASHHEDDDDVDEDAD